MEQKWKSTTARNDGITTTALEKIPEPGHEQRVAEIAYEFWQARGCPDGTPDEDWFRAEQELAALKGMAQKAS
jgi:Protein of unknown function (DUF2934)